MKIALAAPAKDLASETFIKYHYSVLNSDKLFYYGGFTPTSNTDEGTFYGSGFLYKKDWIVKKLFKHSSSLQTRALARSFSKNNISICYAEFGQTGVGVLEACKLSKTNLIVNFHGADVSAKEIVDEHIAKYREVFGYALKIVAVSHKMKNKLIELGCPEGKIAVLPCHPDPYFFSITANLYSKRILAIGRFVDKKAPHLTILAYRLAKMKHPDISLDFVGDGPLLESCIRLSQALEIPDITFHGQLDHSDTKLLFQNCSLFIQHSVTSHNGDSEGTPVSILEAAATGMPIVSTVHAGIPEIIENGKMGLLVNEGDVDGMATNLSRLLENEDLRLRLSKTSRSIMKKNFNMEAYTLKLNEILNMD